jgi:hypothetical protein
MTDSVQPTSATSASYWEDFVDIYYAPSGVFARREHGNPWIPMLFATVIYALLAYASSRVLAPMWDAEWSRASVKILEKNPQLTSDQLAKMRGFASISVMMTGVLAIPLMVLFGGLLTWIVGKLLDAKQGLRTAFLVAAFATFPFLLEQVVYLVEGALMDPASLTSRWAIALSPARLMDPDGSAVLLTLAERLNPFNIWFAALLAIGLKVTGRISARQAAIAGVVLWILGALPAAFAAGQ